MKSVTILILKVIRLARYFPRLFHMKNFLLKIICLIFFNASSQTVLKQYDYQDPLVFYFDSVFSVGEYVIEGEAYSVHFQMGLTAEVTPLLHKLSDGHFLDSTISNFITDTVFIYHRTTDRLVSKGLVYPILQGYYEINYNASDTIFTEDEYGDYLAEVIFREEFSEVPSNVYRLIKNGEWVYFDEDLQEEGRGVFIEELPDSGIFVFENFDRKEKKVMYYDKGKLNGECFEVLPDGSQCFYNYRNGELVGKSVVKKGNKVIVEIEYDSTLIGKGVKRLFDSNGLEVERCGYKKEVPNGLFFQLSAATGDTIIRGNVVDGLKNGNWSEWHENNGVLKSTGTYVLGKKTGTHKVFYPSGILKKEIHYVIYEVDQKVSFGKISEAIFRETGAIQQETIYDPRVVFSYYKESINVLDGVYIRDYEYSSKNWSSKDLINQEEEPENLIVEKKNYNELGIEESNVLFQSGKPYDGVDIELFPNGNIRKRVSYRKGRFEGEYVEYKLNGDVWVQKNYEKGAENGFVVDHYFHGNKFFGAANGLVEFKDEHPSSSCPYVLGVQFGVETNYYENGAVKSSGRKIGWKKDSVWNYYDEKQEVASSETYIYGELLGEEARSIGTGHSGFGSGNYLSSGVFDKSLYSISVFGSTVPTGKHFQISFNKIDTLGYAYFCQSCWDSILPSIEFLEINQRDFVNHCRFYSPLKFGLEQKNGKVIKNHRFYKDSTFYSWSDSNGVIVHSYKMKLAPDFRFIHQSIETGEKKLYSGTNGGGPDRFWLNKEGVVTEYYSNGKKKYEYILSRNNTYVGEHLAYFPSGSIRFKGTYLKGTTTGGIGVGQHFFYDEKGNIRKLIDFKLDYYVIKIFNEKGVRLFEGNYAPSVQGYYAFGGARQGINDEVGYSHVKHGLHSYFDDSGTFLGSKNYEFDEEVTPVNSSIRKYKWKSSQGPIGCDATAFFIDKKGNYWLGTGSSGGVFYSSNNGKSWKMKNNGIGPIHAELIGEIGDTLYLVQALPFPDVKYLHAYYKGSWNLRGEITKEDKKYKELERLANSVEFDAKMITKRIWDAHNPYWVQGGLTNYYFDSRKLEVNYTSAKGESALFFEQPGGNFKSLGEDGGMVYGKLGLYHLKNGFLVENKHKGIQATDIREILTDAKDDIWTVAGLGDVWNYSNKKWKKVFDVHKTWSSDTLLPFLYNTNGLLELHGEIFFSSLGSVWRYTENSQKMSVFKRATEDAHIISFCGKDTVDYFTLEWNKGELNEGSELVYCQYVNSSKILSKTLATGVNNSCLKLSPTGETWLFSSNQISNLSAGITYPLISQLSGFTINANLIAFDSLGGFVFAFSDEELIFYSKSEGFTIQYIEQLKGLSSIYYVNNKIIAGTGYSFRPSCALVAFGMSQGLFELLENGTWNQIENSINPWVMSLGYSKSRGILVGTSGSGLYFLE